MAEVSTNKVISKFYSLLEINLPFLSHISDELIEFNQDLLKRAKGQKVSTKYLKQKYSNSLDVIVEDTFNALFPVKKRLPKKDIGTYKSIIANAFLTLTENRYNSRFLNYFARHSALKDFINNFPMQELFEETLPIFVTGYTITSENSTKKVGLDPYSYRNYFTTKLLLETEKLLEKNPHLINTLKHVSFSYIQPNFYLSFLRNHDDLRLEDITSSLELLSSDLNSDYSDLEFVSSLNEEFKPLKKYSYKSYGPTYSSFAIELFDIDILKKRIKQDPLRYSQVMEKLGLKSLQELIEYAKKVANLSKRLLAFRTSTLIKNNFDYFAQKINEFDLAGIPLYVGKGSYVSDIMELVKKDFMNDFDKKISFFYIGGERGIFENVDIPLKGLSEDSSIRKLLGFISSLNTSHNYRIKTSKTIKTSSLDDYRIDFISSENYPFLLIEKEFKDLHPNIEDVFQSKLAESNLSLDEIYDFFKRFKVGIRRIEPSIVNLVNDSMVNTGLLNVSNARSSFQSLIKDKELILPSQIEGFFEKIVAKENVKGDFRLSLFSLPTNPKILKKYFKSEALNEIDGGCPINKYLSQDLDSLCNALNFKYSLGLDSKVLKQELESKIAELGTLVHTIISAPLNGLVHYNTLTRIGLPPEDSSKYCELPFVVDYDINHNDKRKKVKVSFHPDTLLFLKDKKQPRNLDIIILDTKTKSAHPYFEHKYLLQTYFYANSIAKLVEENLDYKVNDYYLVINRLAFFGKHYAENKDLVYFRQQTLSPVIRITRNDKFHKIANRILETSIDELLKLKEQPELFKFYKERSESKHYCDSCFLNHKQICTEIYTQITKLN
ncbi:MAG: hypothetical protein PWR32_601 [Candidatus Woesearchaeota archaeon]|nr:hypothetical protein [Candidatus Woesearchaeota archaeon]